VDSAEARMTEIRALVLKDLQVHGRPAGALLLGWPVGIRILIYIQQLAPEHDPRALPLVVTLLSLPLFVAVTTGLATMLVDRERAKGTFAWVRTLPVSDAHIVAAKCATGLLFHMVGWVAWWVVLGSVAPSLTLVQATSVWCLTLVAGSLALTTQLAVSGRLAAASPLVLFALGLLAGAPFRRSPTAILRASEWWNGTWEHVFLWTACSIIYALLVALAYARFHGHDAQKLVE
jgi:ABC-type Na+ efflux pump permease subunit